MALLLLVILSFVTEKHSHILVRTASEIHFTNYLVHIYSLRQFLGDG